VQRRGDAEIESAALIRSIGRFRHCR